MDEAKAREIYRASDLSQYSWAQLRAADAWVKEYAMAQFVLHLKRSAMDPAIKEFTLRCTSIHFGSADVDEMLTKLGCYPDWVGKTK